MDLNSADCFLCADLNSADLNSASLFSVDLNSADLLLVCGLELSGLELNADMSQGDYYAFRSSSTGPRLLLACLLHLNSVRFVLSCRNPWQILQFGADLLRQFTRGSRASRTASCGITATPRASSSWSTGCRSIVEGLVSSGATV